jgi:hypothetical protein
MTMEYLHNRLHMPKRNKYRYQMDKFRAAAMLFLCISLKTFDRISVFFLDIRSLGKKKTP